MAKQVQQQVEHDLVVQSLVLLAVGTAAALAAINRCPSGHRRRRPLLMLAAFTSSASFVAGFALTCVLLGKRMSRAGSRPSPRYRSTGRYCRGPVPRRKAVKFPCACDASRAARDRACYYG